MRTYMDFDDAPCPLWADRRESRALTTTYRRSRCLHRMHKRNFNDGKLNYNC